MTLHSSMRLVAQTESEGKLLVFPDEELQRGAQHWWKRSGYIGPLDWPENVWLCGVVGVFCVWFGWLVGWLIVVFLQYIVVTHLRDIPIKERVL